MTNKLEEAGISWVILGSQTKPYKPPKIEWVQEIVETADKAGVEVFLKDNLRSMLCDALALHNIERRGFFCDNELRQDFPC